MALPHKLAVLPFRGIVQTQKAGPFMGTGPFMSSQLPMVAKISQPTARTKKTKTKSGQIFFSFTARPNESASRARNTISGGRAAMRSQSKGQACSAWGPKEADGFTGPGPRREASERVVDNPPELGRLQASRRVSVRRLPDLCSEHFAVGARLRRFGLRGLNGPRKGRQADVVMRQNRLALLYMALADGLRAMLAKRVY